MSLASDLTELACDIAGGAYGEIIMYRWSEPLSTSAKFIKPAFWTLTSTSDGGTLQSAPASTGPWSDVLTLSATTQTVAGNAWFKLVSANGVTEWDIEIVVEDAVRTRGNWRTDEPAAKQVAISERIQHWLVAVEDLTHPNGDEYHEPRREDVIETEQAELFRVMPQSKDGPLWRWVNEHGKTHRRIFSRERGS